MSGYLRYALVSTLVLLLSAPLITKLVPSSGSGVWVAAALAYLVQLIAFAGLHLSRGTGAGWLLAWGGGTLLRLLALLGLALWVGRSGGLAPAPTLLSLAGFLFVLMILEPVFFRAGVRSR